MCDTYVRFSCCKCVFFCWCCHTVFLTSYQWFCCFYLFYGRISEATQHEWMVSFFFSLFVYFPFQKSTMISIIITTVCLFRFGCWIDLRLWFEELLMIMMYDARPIVSITTFPPVNHVIIKLLLIFLVQRFPFMFLFSAFNTCTRKSSGWRARNDVFHQLRKHT